MHEQECKEVLTKLFLKHKCLLFQFRFLFKNKSAKQAHSYLHETAVFIRIYNNW